MSEQVFERAMLCASNDYQKVIDIPSNSKDQQFKVVRIFNVKN